MKKLIALVALILALVAQIPGCGSEGGATVRTFQSLPGELPPAYDYVLNRNTRKFHYPDCASVADIAGKNIDYFSGPRDVLIDMGFQPCKRCKP